MWGERKQRIQVTRYQKQLRTLKQRKLAPHSSNLLAAKVLCEIAISEADALAIKAQGKHLHYKKRENPIVRAYPTKGAS